MQDKTMKYFGTLGFGALFGVLSRSCVAPARQHVQTGG